jgi:HEPN domain-containing protein
VTNDERADRLLREVRQIAGEMRRALADEAWNLATCRAQEALELAITALLSEMTVDYPKIHDPAPVFIHAVRARGIEVDAAVLDSLATLSQELASIRGPAFYQETVVTEAQARDWVQRVDRALDFLEELLRRLRRTI